MVEASPKQIQIEMQIDKFPKNSHALVHRWPNIEAKQNGYSSFRQQG